MIEYLVKLMEAGEYQKCLRHSEQQLLRGGMTIAELATLNMVICRCRIGNNDSYGAINSGLLAAKLARDIGDWDTLGRSLLNVGTAYMGTRQHDLALHQLYSYFEHLHKYVVARRFEGAVWKSIGIAHQRKQESDQAIIALERARQWFLKQEVEHSAFTCTHDLINTYLQRHRVKPKATLEPVNDLLKAEKALVAKFPKETYYRGIYLNDKANFYLRSGRLHRAIVCAMQAMELRKGDHQLAFHSHMILYECSRLMGDAKQALGYALAARVAALQGKHYELEYIAAQAMVDIIKEQGTKVVQELDAEYRAMGIDLSQYVTPAMLGRPN